MGVGRDPSIAAGARGFFLSLALGSVLVAECVKQWVRGGLDGWPALFGLIGVLSLKTYRLGANLLLAGVGTFCVTVSFPTTANHVFALSVALWACAAGTWTRMRPSGHPWSPEQLVRWLGFSILFWSGIQKLLHGAYWHGEFLATKLAQGESRWRWFEFLVRPSDLAMLREVTFAGPYRLQESPLALWASRSVPLFEVALAVGLLFPKTAPLAVTLAALLLVSFQSVATEMTFALTMLSILSAFVTLRTQLALVRLCCGGALLLAVAAWQRPGLFN